MEDTRASAAVSDEILAEGPDTEAPDEEIVLVEGKTVAPDLDAQDPAEQDGGEGSPPVTQKQLTPEELAKLAERNAAIQEWIGSLGVFAIVRFKDENSIMSQIQFSEPAPSRDALIAVLEKLARDFKLTEEIDSQSEIMGRMAAAERARQKQAAEKKKVRDRLLGG